MVFPFFPGTDTFHPMTTVNAFAFRTVPVLPAHFKSFIGKLSLLREYGKNNALLGV